MADDQLTIAIEQALTGLVKLMKASRFYPKEHPSLNAAITECMASFQALLLSQDRRAIQASQAGFNHGAEKIGEKNPALPQLAHLLAERRVNRLIFLPDLPASELLILLEGLGTPAEEIYSAGGLPAFLRQQGVASIWLNESSLDGALQKRQQLEADIAQAESMAKTGVTLSPEPPKAIDLAQQIRQIVEQLQPEQEDNTYLPLIEKLLNLAPQYFDLSGAPGILRILPLVHFQSGQAARSQPQRNAARDALEQLLTEPTTNLLLDQLVRTSLTPQQYQRLQHFIVKLGVRIAPQLLALMCQVEDSAARKRISTLLGQMGAPLLDFLREMVHNNNWYVVRNAVTLVGNLRLAAGIPLLEPLVSHPDQRIRRSLVRALAMIGGDSAVRPLLRLAKDSVQELRRPAVIGLGATKSGAAVRPLLAIAQQFDPFCRQLDIRRDAVVALGILGQKKALPPLLGLAKRPNLFRRQRLEEFRAEIILTLGKLGDHKLDRALAHWLKSPHAVVQRAAQLSTTALAKKYDNAAAN